MSVDSNLTNHHARRRGRVSCPVHSSPSGILGTQSGLQELIQFSALAADHRFNSLEAPSGGQAFVGNAQRGQNGDSERVDRRRPVGNSDHVAVHIVCQVPDMVGITPAPKTIRTMKDPYRDALLDFGCHVSPRARKADAVPEWTPFP